MWGHAYRDWAFRLKKIGDLSFFPSRKRRFDFWMWHEILRINVKILREGV
jgi:hypothetical protein